MSTTQQPLQLAPNDVARLMTAYKELLKLDSNHAKGMLSNTLSHLRGMIAEATNLTELSTQTTFEHLALSEKLNAQG